MRSPQDVFSNIIKKRCKSFIIESTKASVCKGFTVLPISECPPAFRKNWLKLFDEDESRMVLNKIKRSHFLNVWTDQSFKNLEDIDGMFEVNSKTALMEIMRKNCPKVFSTLEKFFEVRE